LKTMDLRSKRANTDLQIKSFKNGRDPLGSEAQGNPA